ncbi:hypothetical protein [Okeania sp. SIO2C9]|uniref:hypothetical protein n=1 Tax=Okeania sp. SIO2C9 TaxID=2607791 RepID=UPI0025DAAF5B|nr:hypothetical protein [Okeania sp. SIO2C9]
MNAVENTIFNYFEYSTCWPVIDEDIRRCLMRKFPYGILYTIEDNFILILAVMHCSREPGYWKDRVK